MPKMPTHTNYRWIKHSTHLIKNNSYSKPEYAKLYNSNRWRRLRHRYIRYNPLCIACKENNIIKDANVVDHVKPVSEQGDFYTWSNLQSLCTKCHAVKTAKEVNKRNKIKYINTKEKIK